MSQAIVETRALGYDYPSGRAALSNALRHRSSDTPDVALGCSWHTTGQTHSSNAFAASKNNARTSAENACFPFIFFLKNGLLPKSVAFRDELESPAHCRALRFRAIGEP